MDNQERQRDMEQEEKALRMFDLLQNVPEDLLERSDKRSTGVIMLIQRYRTTLVACLVLLLIGAGVIGYRSAGGFSNGSSNEAAMDAGFGDNAAAEKQEVMEEAALEDAAPAEPEYEYVAENDVVAEIFQEALQNTGEVSDKAAEKTESATVKEDGTGSIGPQGLTAKLSQLKVPDGYEYQSITSALRGEQEVMAIRLQHSDGKYVEIVMQSGDTDMAPAESEKEKMFVTDEEGNSVVLTEDMTLPADEDGVSHLNVIYKDGVTVQYSGTADAGTVCDILDSLK